MKRASLFISVLIIIAFPAVSQDTSLDKKLGEENARMVEQEMGIYHHDSLFNLVNAVGQKLVSRLTNNPFQFKFFLVDSQAPNAFALPGGYIYVTRGILPIINTEDELAGILAHEIIHVTQRHSVKQMKKGLLTGLLKLPGNFINSVTGTHLGNIINAPIDFTTKAFISKYSRGHETEADKFGIQLAASAGYKTDALADALERLSQGLALVTGEQEKHNYFSDHPFTPSRVTAIRSSAPLFKPVKPAPLMASQNAFLKSFDGLCYGPNPEQGLFVDSLFIQPDLRFCWRIPSGWTTMNKPSKVAAYAEQGDGLIAMKIGDSRINPRDITEKARSEAQKNKNFMVLSAGDTIINSYPSYQLRLKSIDKNEVAIMELLWVNYSQDIVFQMVGASIPQQHKNMHRALTSIHCATPEELALMIKYEIKVVSAKSNESVEKISQRTGNKMKADLTAVINNWDPKNRLKEGDSFKIVTSGLYHSTQQ